MICILYAYALYNPNAFTNILCRFDFPAELKDLKDVEKQVKSNGRGGSWLIDLVSCSRVSTPLSTDRHHCHVVSMPDGAALARQIAHH